jgi:hypothetical protein
MLILSADASLWGKKLVRRPILTQHPLAAKIIGIIVSLIVLFLVLLGIGYIVATTRDALGFHKPPLPYATMIIYVLVPILAVNVYNPIRSRLAMYTYSRWLKSFEDEDMQPQRRKDRTLRFARMHFRWPLPRWRRWRRWKQRAPRDVIQESISLLPISHGENSRAELPGEIFLE